jgi:hypothetical protein
MTSSKTHKGIPKNIKDAIEIENRIYLISDKYLENMIMSLENKKLFKYILALNIHLTINNRTISSIDKITKTILANLINSSEKIFAYIITGKHNVCTFTDIEQEVITQIPSSYTPKINPNLCENIL